MEVESYLSSDFLLLRLVGRRVFILKQILRDIRPTRLLRHNSFGESNQLHDRLLIRDYVKIVELNVRDLQPLAVSLRFDQNDLDGD